MSTFRVRGCQIGCYEGGCGACSVVLSWKDTVTGENTMHCLPIPHGAMLVWEADSGVGRVT